MKIKPVILSGGSGVRLWPLSRENQAKQFVDIFNNGSSLFLETLERVNNKNFLKPIIIANKKHRFEILKNIKKFKIKTDKIILEYSQKNTAPAAALASYFTNDNDILCILPADHHIKNTNKFHKTICEAAKIAEKGELVSIGAECFENNVNYGYIVPDYKKKNKLGIPISHFKEKPSKNVANKLINANALWNTGIVLVKNYVLVSLFKKFANKLYEQTIKSCKKTIVDKEFMLPCSYPWTNIKSLSLDYAILEKKFPKYVVALNTKWSDLGTFESLKKIKQETGNVLAIETKNCMTYSNEKLLLTAGVKDLVIVNTKNATLVANKDSSLFLRKAVNKLIKLKKQEALSDSLESRPWGSFENIQYGKGYKVKKLLILPGEKISLQKHLKRSEHWVVVEGKAKVTKGDKVFYLLRNQSIFIDKKQIHRIENTTKKDLVIIEVQTGEYLEEDDIIRIEDKYKR